MYSTYWACKTYCRIEVTRPLPNVFSTPQGSLETLLPPLTSVSGSVTGMPPFLHVPLYQRIASISSRGGGQGRENVGLVGVGSMYLGSFLDACYD